jgi:hypothetical protein
MMIELTGKVGYAVPLEVEIVHVDIQTLAVADIKLLLCILKQECGLSDTTGTLDADEPVVPVDLVHEITTNRCVDMLYEVSMCPEKSFHLPLNCFLTCKSAAKLRKISQIANSK